MTPPRKLLCAALAGIGFLPALAALALVVLLVVLRNGAMELRVWRARREEP